MSPYYIVEFLGDELKYGNVTIRDTRGHGIVAGVTVVIGENGAGKTTLGTILEKGRYAYGNRLRFGRDGMKVKMLKFTDIHSFTGVDVLRFDQRLESSENDYVPTVGEVMGENSSRPEWHELCQRLGLINPEGKKINFLSSGELRKLLIINALLSSPEILILDNPYIGLDALSRSELDAALMELRDSGTAVVLLVCDSAEIPSYADSVLALSDCAVNGQWFGPEDISMIKEIEPVAPPEEIVIPPAPDTSCPAHNVAFAIRNGLLRYGEHKVIEGFDWTVKRGERWMLTGPNGSGKSLLLSVVCGDNPQAFANEVYIFDRRRGTGETLWDIKDNLGYVCPEMQLYFRSPLDVTVIVIEGMRPILKRYGKPTEEEKCIATEWLALLGITRLADRQFKDLSSGEQRLVLLARAFVRQPALLVLDEPFQGLDAINKSRLRRIIDALLDARGGSLIFVTHYPEEVPPSVNLIKSIKERTR